jgi:hypothetical protein
VGKTKGVLPTLQSDWPISTFHGLVKQGVYPADWGGGGDALLSYAD